MAVGCGGTEVSVENRYILTAAAGGATCRLCSRAGEVLWRAVVDGRASTAMVVSWRREGSNALVVVGHIESTAFELRASVVCVIRWRSWVIRSRISPSELGRGRSGAEVTVSGCHSRQHGPWPLHNYQPDLGLWIRRHKNLNMVGERSGPDYHLVSTNICTLRLATPTAAGSVCPSGSILWVATVLSNDDAGGEQIAPSQREYLSERGQQWECSMPSTCVSHLCNSGLYNVCKSCDLAYLVG